MDGWHTRPAKGTLCWGHPTWVTAQKRTAQRPDLGGSSFHIFPDQVLEGSGEKHTLFFTHLLCEQY